MPSDRGRTIQQRSLLTRQSGAAMPARLTRRLGSAAKTVAKRQTRYAANNAVPSGLLPLLAEAAHRAGLFRVVILLCRERSFAGLQSHSTPHRDTERQSASATERRKQRRNTSLPRRT